MTTGKDAISVEMEAARSRREAKIDKAFAEWNAELDDIYAKYDSAKRGAHNRPDRDQMEGQVGWEAGKKE